MKDCCLTEHAVGQFIRRFEPNMSRPDARAEMLGLLDGSKSIGKTLKGDQIVSSSIRAEVRFVIKDLNVCVTVLPKPHHHINEAIALDIEAQISVGGAAEDDPAGQKPLIQSELEKVRAELDDIDLERDKLKERVGYLNVERDRLLGRIEVLGRELDKRLDGMVYLGDIDTIYDDDERVIAFGKRLGEVDKELLVAKEKKKAFVADIGKTITALANERMLLQRKLDEAKNMQAVMKKYEAAKAS